MSWRDNPAIVWEDDDGDRIELVGGFLSAVETDRRVGYASGIDVAAPESVAGRVEATERWLAALGLTADNIRELPHPIEVGDTVTGRINPGRALYRVLHIDGDDAMVRRWIGGSATTVPLVDLVHADPSEPDEPEWVMWNEDGTREAIPGGRRPATESSECEPEWVITRDPMELAAAVDAGRTVQYEETRVGWIDTSIPAGGFRRATNTLDMDYRYEGPRVVVLAAEIDKVEAPPVDRCTPDNRVCDHYGYRCDAAVDGYGIYDAETTWLCTRPDGHDGACVPCIPNEDGADSHNLDLRREDR